MTNGQLTIGVEAEPLPGSDALHCSIATIGTTRAVLTQWDFSRHGGSFGIEASVLTVAFSLAGSALLLAAARKRAAPDNGIVAAAHP